MEPNVKTKPVTEIFYWVKDATTFNSTSERQNVPAGARIVTLDQYKAHFQQYEAVLEKEASQYKQQLVAQREADKQALRALNLPEETINRIVK